MTYVYTSKVSVLIRRFISDEPLGLHGTTRVDWPIGRPPKTPKLCGQGGTRQNVRRTELDFWDPPGLETLLCSIWRVLEMKILGMTTEA